jgi:hypothetical protein
MSSLLRVIFVWAGFQWCRTQSFWNGGRSCWSLRPSTPVISRYKYRGHTGTLYTYSTIHVQLYSTCYSDRQVIQVQPHACTIVQNMVQRQAGHTRTASYTSTIVQFRVQRHAGHTGTASGSSHVHGYLLVQPHDILILFTGISTSSFPRQV